VQSTALVALGWIIHAAGWKMNKQLWSPSYLFFTAGVAGFFLIFFFALLDYPAWQPKWLTAKPFCGFALPDISATPLTWVGMNTLFIYLLSPSGGQFDAQFYFNGEKKNNVPGLFYRNVFCATGECSDFKWTPQQAPPSTLVGCASWDQTIPGCVNNEAAIGSICSICTLGMFNGYHERYAELLWTLVRITFWVGVAGVLHWRRWYWAV
jgi:hypothetical protein